MVERRRCAGGRHHHKPADGHGLHQMDNALHRRLNAELDAKVREVIEPALELAEGVLISGPGPTVCGPLLDAALGAHHPDARRFSLNNDK